MNKKGFTLIEVIAVITIIGVLSGTVIAGVGGSLNKSHEDYCASQVDMMIVSGRDYFHDRTTLLPLEIGAETCVDLSTLTNSKYIEQMKDYQGALCNPTNSKVCATKVTGSNYYYAGYLDCGKCATDNTKKENQSTPEITFNPSSGKVKDKDITVEMKITDKKNEIVSYAYNIYEETKDKKKVLIKKVDFREYKKEKITIKLNKKGTFYIEGYAYNSIGKKGHGSGGPYTLEYTLNCDKSVKITATKGNQRLSEGTWTNGAIDINIEITGAGYTYDAFVNQDGSGYKQIIRNALGKKTISYNEKQTGKYTIKVKMYDQNGNSCETKGIKYYQDNTPPTCQTKGTYKSADESINGKDYNSNWTNQNIILLPICEDKESGCNNQKNLGNLIIKEYNTELSAGRVYDQAGNYAECSKIKVKIDKTTPTCTIKLSGTKGNDDYYKSDVTATITGQDSKGQVNSNGLTYSLNTNKNSQSYGSSTKAVYNTNSQEEVKYYGYIKDIAGNVGHCESKTFKIDKSGPVCPPRNKLKGENTSWTNKQVKITVPCSAPSGCKNANYTATLTNKKPSNGTIETATATVKMQDNAGNTVDCKYDSINIYQDNEAPTCVQWIGNNDWTKNNVTVKLKCKDKGSQCEKNTYNVKTYKGTNSVTKKSGTLRQKICDTVGNCRTCSKSDISVKHDTKKPTCSISLNANNNPQGKNGWYRKNVVGTLSVNDQGGGVTEKGITTTNRKNYNDKRSWTYNNDTKSANFYGYVKDEAGNEGKCQSTSFKKDATPPIAAVGHQPNYQPHNIGTSFYFSYWDATSGLGTTYAYALVNSPSQGWCNSGWQFEGGTLCDLRYFGSRSEYWRAYYAEDIAGNKSNAICWYQRGNNKTPGTVGNPTCTVNGGTFTP